MAVESPKRPGMREAVKLEFRSRVLDAALDVFSEAGYEAAQMREIAERAGVAVGTIYNLFESKEGLYRAIVLEHAADIAAAFGELFRRADDETALLLRYIELKGELFARKEKPLRLFFSVAGPARVSARHGLDAEHREIYNRLLRELAGVFERALAKGRISASADPHDLAVALDGMTNAFVVLGMDFPGEHAYADKVSMLFRLFFGPLASEEEIERTLGGASRPEVSSRKSRERRNSP